MTAIVGPNGAGKSSLLKAMMGLTPIAGGYVKFFDKNLEEARDKISYMPQKESVDWDFPITVEEVVMMGRYKKLGLFKKERDADKLMVKSCLEKVGLQAFAQRQISQLSGGQQQRVFLARALAQDSELFIMDEPFAGVDVATEELILAVLRSMKNSGKTIIVVHHDLQSVAEHFDYAILLNTRKIASGPVTEVLTEPILQATYGGKLNILSDVGQLLSVEQVKTRKG